jgi:DNA mismatch endonuclease (patch repair protein)
MHGCYWHGHEGCKYFYTPKTNTEFWVNKISSNKERDSRNVEALKSQGWRIVIVWECSIAYKKDISIVIKQIHGFILDHNRPTTSIDNRIEFICCPVVNPD